jgi:hypothetical protein
MQHSKKTYSGIESLPARDACGKGNYIQRLQISLLRQDGWPDAFPIRFQFDALPRKYFICVFKF